MNALLTSFVSGMVFALGLGISGMTRPVKVIGFLDFFGAWDASLAFVMIGAIAVYLAAYQWSGKMSSPLLAADFSLPQAQRPGCQTDCRCRAFRRGLGPRRFLPRTRADRARFRGTSGSDLRRRDDGWYVAAHMGDRIGRDNRGLGDIAIEEHAGCMNGAAQSSPDGQKSLAVATSVTAPRMSTRATCMPTTAAAMAEGLPTTS